MTTEIKTILQILCLAALLIVLGITGVTLYRFNMALDDFRGSSVFQAIDSVENSSLESLAADTVQDEIQDFPLLEEETEDGQLGETNQKHVGADNLDIQGVEFGEDEQEPEENRAGKEPEDIPENSGVASPTVEVESQNICNRTPEIQQRLIEMLKITSCRDITSEGLVRVRDLELGRMPLKIGDLDGFINLTTLTLFAEDAPVGLFDDLTNLQNLELVIEKPPSPGLFQTLAKLQQMTLYIEAQDDAQDLALQGVFDGLTALIDLHFEMSDQSDGHNVPLMQGSLVGMPNLQTLEVSNISRVESGTLHDLPALRSVNLRALSLPDHLSKPSLPSDVFAGNPDMERISLSGFREVSRLDFNSLDVICRMQRNMDLRYGVDFAVAVQGDVVEVIDYDWDYEELRCTLRVAPFGTENWDEVKITVRPLPEPRRN